MSIDPRPGYEVKPDSVEDYILKNAMSKIIILDSSPTTANAILGEGRIGQFETGLFITIGGSTYKIATMTLV